MKLENEPIVAPHPGFCAICAEPIYTGDRIYIGVKSDNDIAVHERCIISDGESND